MNDDWAPHQRAVAIMHRIRTCYAKGRIDWLVSDQHVVTALEEALDGKALERLWNALAWSGIVWTEF